MSTLMSDEIFHEVAYKSRTRKDLLAGIDEFLDKTTVLPPGEWDPRIRIEPPSHLAIVDIKERLNRNPDDIEKHDPDHEIFNHGGEHGVSDALTQTGTLFGGLVNDVKRKMPFYRVVSQNVVFWAENGLLRLFFVKKRDFRTFLGQNM